jgi:outer membrane immunogenic protein
LPPTFRTSKGRPFAPPPFTWAGLYIGGQVGYTWGATNFSPGYTNGANPILGGTYIFGLPSYDGSGVIGGGHLGYNWQVGSFVAGVEGDINGSSYSGSGAGTGTAGGSGLPAVAVPFPAFSCYDTRIPIQASFDGRLGYAFDRVLVYAIGGGVWADVTNFTAPGGASDSFTASRWGWQLGAGIEYAIDPQWSVRIEYRYTELGTYNVFLANTYPGDFVNLKIVDDAVTVGASYKFDLGPGPVIAKY